MDLTWQDIRLGWPPEYYGGVEALSLPGSRIWTPAFSLERNADTTHHGLQNKIPIRVSKDGLIEWRVETLTTTVCDADPFFFPADTMECHVCFSTVTAIQCAGGIAGREENVPCDASSSAVTEGEWYRSDKIFNKDFKEACFALYLSRIPLFHIATTVGPCVILVVLMNMTFIMPIDKLDRISFGVTILLSMVVSLVFVTSVLPVKGALPFFGE
ncbi:neuronal acetylcholine receptor subunit alpha-10-like [Branchiostoma lanceolatum]|uniref:neuronal acetylcholine receptor subunit alpha-10-like n=1 Tax=Branchiostoma lanceolatum TaxID=7740 RepID=UPI0034554B9A